MVSKNKKSFLKNAAIYGLGGVATQIAGIILLPLYTQYLTPIEFGVLDLVNRVGQVILITLMVNGLRMATLTFYQQAENSTEKDSVASSQTALVLLIVLSFGTLSVVFSGWLAQLAGIKDPDLLSLGIIASLSEALLIVPLALIQARIESTTFVVVSLGMLVCRVALCILALAYFQLGLFGVLWSSIVVSVGFGGLLTAREINRGSLRLDLRQVVSGFRFAIPFLPAGILAFVMVSSDRFLLNASNHQEELGLYSLAMRLATAVVLFSITPIYRVWSSTMYDVAKRDDAATNFGEMYTRMMHAFVVVGLLFAMFSPELVYLLASEEFYGTAALVAPLVLSQYFYNGASALDAAFYVQRKTNIKPLIILIATVATLILYVLFIPKYGASAAAWSSVIGNAIYWQLTWIFAQRVFPIRFDWIKNFGVLGLAAIVQLVSSLMPLSIVAFLVKATLFLTFMVAIWFLKFISDADRDKLLSAFVSLKQRLKSTRVSHK